MLGSRTFRRLAGLLASATVGICLVGGMVGTAHAGVVAYGGPNLGLSAPPFDFCRYEVRWEAPLFGGNPVIDSAQRTVTAVGPTVRAPVGRTIYYRVLLVDSVNGNVVRRTNFGSARIGQSGSVHFGSVELVVPWTSTEALHPVVAMIDVWSYQGMTPKAHLVWKTTDYVVYGLDAVGVANGQHLRSC